MEESTYLFMFKNFTVGHPAWRIDDHLEFWYSEGEGIPYVTGGLHRFCKDIRTRSTFIEMDAIRYHNTSYVDKKQRQKFKNDVKS